jgi:NifU-like protein involved in Fe-S cluster formation
MIIAEKILDYDQLVNAYSANLEATLRGFRPAEELLDTWVPDEDPLRSLSSLVEAAQLCGSHSVAVRVSNKTIAHLAVDSLKEKLATFGEVAVTQEPDAAVFTITLLQETASFRSVRPIYQQKLRARFANLRFKRPLRVADAHIPLRAVEEGFSLAWAVQADNHVISDAAFDTASLGPMAPALDCLCELLVGLPIQEARDHAVIRLEFSLRDPGQTHPVAGIVLPHNADPIFRVPSILVNRLFEDYKTSTKYQPAMNFFDPGPRPAWAVLPHTERAERVAAAIATHGPALGVAPGEVHVVECKRPYAVTIQFNGGLTIPAKRAIALTLERLVRKECDPRLEVFCEEKKDLSKLRRQIEHAAKEKAEP